MVRDDDHRFGSTDEWKNSDGHKILASSYNNIAPGLTAAFLCDLYDKVHTTSGPVPEGRADIRAVSAVALTVVRAMENHQAKALIEHLEVFVKRIET